MTRRQIFSLLLLSASWGVSFLMIRIAGESFPPLWIAFLRSVLGAMFLACVLKARGHVLPQRRLGVWLVLVALFNNVLPFTCFAWGERIVVSSTAAVLNATTPIWAFILTLVVQRARPRIVAAAGIALGFLGVLLVVYGQQPSGSDSIRLSSAKGVAVIAIGALGYAIATVLAKTKLRGEDPIGLATTQLSLSAVLLFPVVCLTHAPERLQLTSVLAVGVLGLVGSGIAYLLFYSLLAQISATRVAAVAYLLPMWGLFWGRLAGEAIRGLAYLGVFVAVAGLLLINRGATSNVSTSGLLSRTDS